MSIHGKHQIKRQFRVPKPLRSRRMLIDAHWLDHGPITPRPPMNCLRDGGLSALNVA